MQVEGAQWIATMNTQLCITQSKYHNGDSMEKRYYKCIRDMGVFHRGGETTIHTDAITSTVVLNLKEVHNNT